MESTCWRFVSHLPTPSSQFSAVASVYLLNVYQAVSSQGCYISLHWRLELRENDFLCARRAESQEEGKRNTFLKTRRTLTKARMKNIFLNIPHFVLLLCFFCSDGVKREHSEELTSWAVKKKKSDPEFHLLCNDKLNSRRRNERWWARVECVFF